jgi:single-strand DNA-binding protein
MKAITIVGTVGKDSEIQENAKGQSVAISVAVNRGYKREDGTDWFTVYYWNTKVAEFIKKGTKITASGSLQIVEREGQDGQKRTYFNVRASDIDFTNQRKPEQSQASNSYTEHERMPEGANLSNELSDEIPF